MKFSTVLFIFLLLSISSLAFAQATGTWALTSDASYAVTGNVTGTNMAKGSGTGAASYGTDGVYSNGWNSASLDANDYYQYTVTATSAITINSVSLYTMKSGGTTGTGAVYYSVNGGTETQLGSNITLSATNTQTSITGLNISVPNGQNFRVRFYAWSLSKASRSVYNRDVTIVSSSTALSSSDPAVAAANLNQASTKNPVYKFTLNSNSAINFTGLSFTSSGTYTGTDLVNFQLWTYTSDTFASATQVGTSLTTTLGTGSHSFAAFTQALTAGATRYFWITTDLATTAIPANTLSISALATSDITTSAGVKTGTAYAGGTQTFVFTTLASDYFRSNSSGNWATAGTWQSSHDNATWDTATLSPTDAANTITIRTGNTVTVAAGVSTDQTVVDSGGQINVSSGITLTIANGTGTDLTVNGTLRNNAGTITTTGTLAFGSGSLYQSNFTTTVGLIPTATWDTNSTCEVIGYTTFAGDQTGLGQSFGNFTWNCPAQTGAISANEVLDTITGNLTITATNTGSFVLGNAANTTTIGKNLLISAGTLNMSAGGAIVVNLSGNFTMTGGTLTETSTGSGQINFAGTTNQLITITGTPTISNTINFAVNSGAVAEFASDSTVLSGSGGTFTANSGSTLIIKHAGGIASSGATGCIQTTGTRTFNTAANYTYDGIVAQVTGTGLTGAANLTINNGGNNAATVTLSAAVTTTGNCAVKTGATLITNNFNVALAGNFTNVGTFTAGSSAITIQGTATTQSIAGFTTTGLVSMTKTAGTATFTGNVSGAGYTSNGNGGTLNLGTGLTHTFSGTWTRTNGTLNCGSSTLRLGSGFSGTTGTFTAGTGTVEYYAEGTQAIAAVTYNNLTLSGSGAKTTTGATVNGVLLMEGTATTTGTAYTYGASSSLRYNGSGIQTVGIEWPSTFARPITISNANGVVLNASKAAYTGTLTNNGKLTTANYQLTGTVVNNGTIAAARTTIMSSGTLTNNTGSTIDYTTPLNIPASTGYYNLTLSATGTYNLTGNVTGINTLTLTTPTTYLQIGSYTVGYATLAGLGSIISPSVTLASSDPAVAAANLGQSTTANPVYKFTLTPNYAMNFTGLSFTTTGSYVAADLVNFKLLTNTTDTFSSATQVGTTLTTGLGTGSHSFAAFTQALTIDATRYFWITADVAASATAANTLAVSALTTGDITTSTGSKTGTAYNGGTQTIIAVVTTLASADPAVTSGNIGVGSTANVFYAFNLAAVYPVNLTAVTIATTGNALDADLNNMRLWTSATNSFASAAQIGSTLTTGLGAGNHAFTGLTQALTAEATRYFWVTVEIDAAATVTRTITASALTTTNFTVSLGSKTGTAYAGGTQTIIAVVTTLASANPAVTAANIGRGTLKNPIYRFTLNPTIGFNFTGLNFVANGTYQAADIDNFKLWSSLTDDLNTGVQVGTTLTTIAASGSQQTFASFTQALSAEVTRYFWITTDLDVAATAARTITVAALTTARVTVSLGSKTGTPSIGGTQTIVAGTVTLSSSNPATAAGSLVQGAEKMPIYRFVLTRDAPTGDINVSTLSFSTSGTYAAADISRFQLWYSTYDDLRTGAWVGGDITTGLGTGSHTFGAFTVAVPIVESTAHYFWITANVAAAATVGNTLTVAAITTASYTQSSGTKAGTAYGGSAQTVSTPVTTLSEVEHIVYESPLAQGSLKRPIGSFKLTTDGLVNVTGISFTSAGTYSASDITKFQLWTGINEDFSGAGQIGGDITSSLGAGLHSFGSFTLSLSHEEPIYFFITTDASESATVGNKIYTQALSTSNFTVSFGNKAGSSTDGGEQTFCTVKPWLHAIGQPVGPLVGAGTGYQLRVTVHYGSGTDTGEHVYLDSKCRKDFGDIRFYEGPTALDYWIETMTFGSSATLWVEISGDMSTNAIPFSIRFGNESATTTSNGNNTFLFFDDFNRTDNTFAKWTKHKTLDGSTISIPVGKNYARLAGGIPTGTYGHSVLGSSATYSGMTDGSVEYRLRVGQDAISEVGVRGTFANPGTGYKGRIDGRVNYQGGSSILYPPYYSWTWLADAPELFDWPTPGAWYHGTINAFGTTINLLKDDVLKRSSSLGTVSGPGEISLQNHYGPYSDYDWVAVRKYVGGQPAYGPWIWAPVAYEASAVCHNGFTAHWEAVPGATGYQLDVLEDDGVTIVDGWDSVPVNLTVHRVEIIDIATANKYRIRALFNSDVSPNSNVISVSTTEIIDGVTASTTILGEPVRTFVPPVTDDPPFTNNDITIDPVIETTWDYSLVVTWHPDGYDSKPNARLIVTVNCSENSALSGVYNINHAGMGFTPAAAAYKWGGSWFDLSPTFGADSTIVVIPSLSKNGSKGELIIALDDGSGTLPVELTSFLASINAYNNVQLKWVTQSETNVSGYAIYRGMSEFIDEAANLGAFIPATNTSQVQVYMYNDTNLTEPGVYFYWLENLDLDGSSMFHGPISITYTFTDPGTPSIPVIAGLNNVYPNPFNPTATIRYGVPEKNEVELVIYNIKGQIVKRLMKEPKTYGTYDVVWNGKDDRGTQVSSGVYIIKMRVGKQFWNSKLVLSK